MEAPRFPFPLRAIPPARRHRRSPIRSVPSLIACLGAFVFAASATEAGVKTRPLPALDGQVEPSLAARAEAGGRVHAIVRVGDRSLARAGGVRLLRSIDGDLWLASIPGAAVRGGEPPQGVVAAWDLRAEDRLSPDLGARLQAEPGPHALRVKLFGDTSIPEVRASLEALGGDVVRELAAFRVLDANVPSASLAAVLAIDGVRWVERAPGPAETANNGLRFDARVNSVQSLGLGGTGVVLGMWDSGIGDATHPDLVGRISAGESGLLVSPHSTHVSGIAIGDGTNSLAEGGLNPLQWRGVATGAEIVAYSLADALAEVDTALAAYAIDVSTNSWTYVVNGGNCALYGDYASDAPEYDDVVRGVYGAPIPIVFAAGNERDDGDCAAFVPDGYGTLPPPGTAKNLITVGAHLSDAQHMTAFSSWGPTDDGRMKPDMTAPGCQQTDDFGITSTEIGGGYFAQCGTSMATPAVAGAIALLTEDWRAFFPGDPRPATHKALLGGYAQDRGPAGVDYRFGLGAIDVEASTKALRTATTIEDAVADLATDEWTFHVPAGLETLRVTLAWDDPAGAELADTTLVNDLDLELVDPSLSVRLPFVLDPANPGAVASLGVNRLDNVEQVQVVSPAPGEWLARVKGTAVPDGPQDYTLVGFDARATADPAAAFASGVDDTTVALTWIRPGDADRAGTLIVRSDTPIAWTPADGTTYAAGSSPSPGVEVVVADDGDHSVTPFADEPLAPGTVWHYAFFGYDEIPNYSVGVADTAETSAFAVPVPEALAPRAEVRFTRAGPQPTAGRATFRLELPARAWVTVSVHDAAGRRVAMLANGERDAGSHVLVWAGGGAAGGVYFARLVTSGVTRTEKIVRVR